jgi:sigma-E factor negative regulatory protein RseC
MDNPKGRVLSLVGGANDARAVVAIDSAQACPRCAAGKGCGAGSFLTGDSERQVEATVPEGLSPMIDDIVEISLAPNNLLRAALIVYGIPMLGALAGAVIAYAASLGDAGAATAALLGLGFGLVISRWRVRQASCLRRFTPTIERLC